ncbi:MAG TPA: hypothetical protein VMD53_01000 [Rhizomicrobium sp.]|nr:hypothetical protein [Rhizomicrobium sp.]
MRMERFLAAVAITVAAFLAVPAMESISASAATDVSQTSVQKCRYYYYGGHRWRYRWHGGYYNYHWNGRYYRSRYHCNRAGGWCYR